MSTSSFVHVLYVIFWMTSAEVQPDFPVTCLDFVRFSERLNNFTFETFLVSNLPQCAFNCYAKSKCKSFNFGRRNGRCELNEEDDTSTSTTSDATSMFGRRTGIPASLTGTCTGHSCLSSEMCLPEKTGYRCLPLDEMIDVDCGPPPSVPNTTVQYSSRRLSAVARYQCVPPLIYRTGDATSQCTQATTWTTPTIVCTELRVISEATNQPIAKAACKDMGGGLATLYSPEDAQVVTDFLNENQVREHVWIGLEYKHISGSTWAFMWADGRRLNDEDEWSEDDPDSPSTKRCVVKRRNSRELDDKNCETKFYFALCSVP